MKGLMQLMGWSVLCLWPVTAGAQGISLKRGNTSPVPDTLIRHNARAPLPFKPAPVSYNYYQSLGAACKVELKLERATKIPFRFRLGSLQQTDYLEQKPNAQKPQ